jgi:hypothetical protein
MTTRNFSILRRRAGLVDLVTPLKLVTPSVKSYRLKTDTTPSGAFATTVMTVSRTGFVDKDVAGAHNVIQPGENVRMIFKPSNFGLSDTAPFWLKLVYIDEADAEMVTPAPSAPTLIGSPNEGYPQVAFTASAPLSALRIDLPRTLENVKLRNLEAANTLMVAFQEGGGEATIPFGTENVGVQGGVSSIWVRGVGGAVSFSFTGTYAR